MLNQGGWLRLQGFRVLGLGWFRPQRVYDSGFRVYLHGIAAQPGGLFYLSECDFRCFPRYPEV